MTPAEQQHEKDVEQAARLLANLVEEQDYERRLVSAFEVVEALIRVCRP